MNFSFVLKGISAGSSFSSLIFAAQKKTPRCGGEDCRNPSYVHLRSHCVGQTLERIFVKQVFGMLCGSKNVEKT